MNDKIVSRVISCLSGMNNNRVMTLTENSYIGLVIHISIAINRIMKNEVLPEDEKWEHKIAIDEDYRLAEQIVAQERNYRKQYITRRKMTALDMVYRSYGVLKYARKVTLNDGELLLSQIRFGLASGIIKADGFDESNIYQLMIGIHPANLLMISNKDMDEEELEVSRADFIREHLPTIH